MSRLHALSLGNGQVTARLPLARFGRVKKGQGKGGGGRENNGSKVVGQETKWLRLASWLT